MNFRVRFQATDTGRTWQITATDDQDSGGIYRDIKGTTQAIYSHTSSDERIPYSNPINTGELRFGIWIDDDPFDNVHQEEVYNDFADISDVSLICACNEGRVDELDAFTDIEDLKSTADEPQNIIDSLIGADDTRYQVSLQYKDLDSDPFTTEWRGYIIPDLTTFEEDSKPYRANIVCRDFSVLSGDYAPGGADSSYDTIIEVFAGILDDLGLNRPIKAVTPFTNEQLTTAECYLHQVYMSRYQLQDGLNDSDRQQIPKKEALERLLKNHNLILFQSEGYFWLVNMSGMTDADSVFVTEYNASGVYQSDSTEDLSATPSITTQSTVSISPAIKTVTTRYQHNGTVYGFSFEEAWQTNNSTDKVFSGVFLSTGEQSIVISGSVQATDSSLVTSPEYEVKIQAGQYYYDGLEWVDGVVSTITRTLDYRGIPDSFNQYSYIADFGINTVRVPDDLDTDLLTITFFNPTHSSGDFLIGNFSDFEFSINESQESPNNYIDYRESNTGELSIVYDIGTIYYGDRITYNSKSGLRKSSVLDFINGEWKRRGETLESSFQRLLILDILNFYKDTKELIQAETFSNYLPWQTVSYDGKDYFTTSSSCNLYTGRSSLTMMETALSTDATDGIVEIPGKPPISSISTLAGVVRRSNYITPSGELKSDVTIESGGSSGSLSSKVQYLNDDGELTEIISAGTADFKQTIVSRAEFSSKQNNVPSKSQVFLFSYDGTGGLTDNEISGFSGGSEGKLIRVINVGSNSIVLSANDTDSTAGNRILGSDITLSQYDSATLIYLEDYTGVSPATTIDAWVVVSNT